jgi:hypothetical protein
LLERFLERQVAVLEALDNAFELCQGGLEIDASGLLGHVFVAMRGGG